MGISRDSRHKRRKTGGRRKVHQKKRKYELGRQPAMTKIGTKRVVPIRTRGGNHKYRALRLETGNFSWGTQTVTRRARILDVTYNASNNELVRTKTLVKNCIIQIDATPFRSWYEQRNGVTLVKAKGKGIEVQNTAEGGSKHVQAVRAARRSEVVDDRLVEQFMSGRVYACVSSRPGQSGRCDGYILEGPELDFYLKKMQKKKGKKN